MTTEPMDPDPVTRVQQRFAKLETTLEEERGRPPAPPAAPAPTPPAPVVDTSGIEAAVLAVRARLDQQLDELRHELEGAFDEVCSMVERTAQAVDAQQHAIAALEQRLATAEVDLTPLLPPIAALDEKVRAIGRMLDASTTGPSSSSQTADVDLTPVVQGMARLSRDLAEQRADLSRLAHALHTTTDDGVEVDMAYLEEVVRRGAVANAADIANLRTDVEQLTATLQGQATSLVEMRKQMEWIRQRLLGR
ncbi:MAG: hypothetical protein ACO1PW_01785 [Actinomycetota bacterium]